ncbi:TPA: DNA alkylation repair protein [Candidatus Bathyarchaeota archaeon]|nr:DNA alkylation repair protein [Candidatus Bathyarchaeota archaeon]
MSSSEEILKQLRQKANPANLEGMKRYGIAVDHRLGVSVANMRLIVKGVKKNHTLALELWKTGLAEGKIVASMVEEPENLTEEQMDEWVMGFDSWDVCDQVCMNLFEKSPLAWIKILQWSKRDEPFVKRAAFALIACLAWHDKRAKDEDFTSLFSVMKSGAVDERNFVKKSVNWALRNVGKRNLRLNKAAIAFSRELLQMDSKVARWIGSDALRELESEAVQRKLSKKAV